MADIVGKIIEFESGEMSDENAVEFFQELVDSGMVWQLQGSYGRTAMDLIEVGLVTTNRRLQNHDKIKTAL